jgi:ABC-2 type transport system permease protein
VTEIEASTGSTTRSRAITAQAGQIILFFLTIILATMILSQLIEEKSNKIIEVLAAAVPIEAIFLGKLFAMLATSVIGIAVWVSLRAPPRLRF